MIKKDKKNEKKWKDLIDEADKGKFSNLQEFVEKMSETFRCCICFDLLAFPVTTPCGHSLCRSCFQQAMLTDSKRTSLKGLRH